MGCSSRESRRLVLLVLLGVAAAAPGCSSWHRSALAPDRQIAESGERTLRVHLKNGQVLDLEHPHAVGDSLVGEVRSKGAVGSRHRSGVTVRAAVAVADIADVRVSRHDNWRTVGLVAVMTGVGILILIGVGYSSLGPVQ